MDGEAAIVPSAGGCVLWNAASCRAEKPSVPLSCTGCACPVLARQLRRLRAWLRAPCEAVSTNRTDETTQKAREAP